MLAVVSMPISIVRSGTAGLRWIGRPAYRPSNEERDGQNDHGLDAHLSF